VIGEKYMSAKTGEDESSEEEELDKIMFVTRKVDHKERGTDEAVTQTITHNFLNEHITDPLIEQPIRYPHHFIVYYRQNMPCCIHSKYIEFLNEKELERDKAIKSRRAEVFRRQEEHAMNLRL
jgi:hypothetical protein